jgi:beta-N-acetylhexosaminidase
MAAKDSFRKVRERLRHLSDRAIIALGAAALLVVVVVTLAVAGGGDDKPASRAATPPPPDRPIARRSFLEQVIPVSGGALPGAGATRRIAAAVRAMSVKDKVAQTMLIGYEGNGSSEPVLSLLRRRALGGIVIRSNNYSSTDQVTGLAARATLVARHAKQDPPLIWAPQEGGDFNAVGGVGPAKAPGDAGGLRAATHEILASGRKLSRLDVNGVLAPVVDIGTEDASDPLGLRAFSNQPRPAAQFATASVNAYKRAGLMSAAEHFPGLGGATQSPDDGPASVGLSLAQLRKRDLVPFAAAISAGVPAIVISNASYSTDDFVTPATLSRAVSTDLLRGELNFRGVAIADDLSQPAITTSMSVADAAVKAIAAGSDMVYISGTKRGQDAAFRALLKAVQSGAISRARLDEAVMRVLTMKREYGLVRGTRPRTKVTAPVTSAATTTPAVPTQTAPPATTPAPPSTQSAAPPGH